MRYKDTVRSIVELPWKNLSVQELFDLMVLSYFAATEFAESLRITLRLHPENEGLKRMAKGELQTNNLQFDSYNHEVGDHADFLGYFMGQYEFSVRAVVVKAGIDYIKAVRAMSDQLRAMSIFSREQELTFVFEAIREARGWKRHPSLEAFGYYLDRHMELDSGEGGHGEMVSEMEITDEVDVFYQARRRILYKPLFPYLIP